MNLKTYIEKRVGTTVDFDGYYGSQCVDQARDYAVNVLGENFTARGHAGSLFAQYWGSNFVKHKNTVSFLPLPGDICLWSGPTIYGHIGVVVSATLNEIVIIDQNTGDGSGSGIGNNKIRVHKYSYKDIQGFVRHKSLNTVTPLSKSTPEESSGDTENENNILRRRDEEVDELLHKALKANKPNNY